MQRGANAGRLRRVGYVRRGERSGTTGLPLAGGGTYLFARFAVRHRAREERVQRGAERMQRLAMGERLESVLNGPVVRHCSSFRISARYSDRSHVTSGLRPRVPIS